jgi:transcriptional regulator with XRE-family HTH domain
VNTNSKLPEICKEAFTKAREKLDLSSKELGVMACLSTRQIEQIENGEMSSFYGAQIKVTAAKKVAKLLNLSDEEAFNYGSQTPEKLSTAPAELPIAELKSTPSPKAKESKKASSKNADAKPDNLEIKVKVEETQLPAKVIAEEKKEPVVKAQPQVVQVQALSSIEVSSKPRSSSQKKLFLWFSVAAAAVFAVINLNPLFFSDKPEAIVLVKEELVEPAPAAAPTPAPNESASVAAPTLTNVNSATTANAAGACPAEEGIISFKPEAPRKVADMVFVQTKSQQVICVIDASGKTQNKLLEPGVGATFYGKPPFKVLTAGLNQVDVFFQGAKVRLSNLNTKTLILEASEVLSSTTDRSDSQVR